MSRKGVTMKRIRALQISYYINIFAAIALYLF